MRKQKIKFIINFKIERDETIEIDEVEMKEWDRERKEKGEKLKSENLEFMD